LIAPPEPSSPGRSPPTVMTLRCTAGTASAVPSKPRDGFSITQAGRG
jgi:hypothetical protein